MKELLKKSGKDFGLNKKADLLTRIADSGVQYLKAADRFEYLLDQMTQPDYHDPVHTKKKSNDVTAQIESKITYSKKALFAELGGDSVLRVFADELRNLNKLPKEEQEGLREEIDEQIRRFVIGRVDASREKEGTHKKLVDQLIEMRTRVSYLEEALKKAREKGKGYLKEVKALRKEVSTTNRDFKALATARDRVSA